MSETQPKKSVVALRKTLLDLDLAGKPDSIKLTLKELVKATEVSERTIRYYIQEGVLPPPQGSGPASRYGSEHLTRLSLVRRFKAALLPLSQIKQLFDELTLEELERVADQFHAELAKTNPLPDDKNQAQPKQYGNYVGTLTRPRQTDDRPLEVFQPPQPAQARSELPSVSNLEVLSFAGRWNRIALAPGLEIHYLEGGPHDTSEGREQLAHLVELAMRLYQN